MKRRGVLVALVAVAGGVGTGVLASVVPAANGQCDVSTSTTGLVTADCDASGGQLTLAAGTPVTVTLAGGSGGNSTTVAGAPGAVVTGVWTPEADTVVAVAPGARGANGVANGEYLTGGTGGGGSWITSVSSTPAAEVVGQTLFVAGGGGGAGQSFDVGGAGAGGTPNGGTGGGGATGASQEGPGAGAGQNPSSDGTGSIGGAGADGGGSGGSGWYGGGGDASGRQGGGGGGSSYGVTDVTYGPNGNTGDGWARLTWQARPGTGTAPVVTSGDSAAFIAGLPGAFTVTAIGVPTPVLSVDGVLPAGLSFTDNHDGTGVISGQPVAGYGGVATVTIRASNGQGPDVLQTLRISVAVPDPSQQPPTTTLPPQVVDPTTSSGDQRDPDLVPVADKSIVVAPISGTVLIRKPNGEAEVLQAGEEIPVGSVIDARNGVVRLTAARDANGVVQTALFWNAVFQVTQLADPAANGGGKARAAASSRKLLTRLNLRQQPTGCPTGKRGKAHAAAKKTPGLWGDGHGRFQVRGNSSSATVRGTRWYVDNRCAGTYTRVVRGIVAVNDFVTKKTIVLRAGGTYTAKRRG